MCACVSRECIIRVSIMNERDVKNVYCVEQPIMSTGMYDCVCI